MTAPLVTAGRSAFPRVARLTRLLRWNPLALDIADAITGSGDATVDDLETFLATHGVGRVRVIDHEDDLPEVALLVDWAWSRLSAGSRRILGALSHMEGDRCIDRDSLAYLSHIRHTAEWGAGTARAMASRAGAHGGAFYGPCRRTPRRATHRTTGEPARAFEYYVARSSARRSG